MIGAVLISSIMLNVGFCSDVSAAISSQNEMMIVAM